MNKNYIKILFGVLIFSLSIKLNAETKDHFDNNLEKIDANKIY